MAPSPGRMADLVVEGLKGTKPTAGAGRNAPLTEHSHRHIPPLVIGSYGLITVAGMTVTPLRQRTNLLGPLVLVRHGSSEWNKSGRCTGWQDVPLSPKGVRQARELGSILDEAGAAPDVVHTSVLQRASATAEVIVESMGPKRPPIHQSWRLNERNGGATEGLTKVDMVETYGRKVAKSWKRSMTVRPPALATDDPRHPRNDPRYGDVPPEELPAGESLGDVLERALPYWHGPIAADLLAGKSVLVVTHGDLIRAILHHLGAIAEADLRTLAVPNASARTLYLGDTCSVVEDDRIDLELAG